MYYLPFVSRKARKDRKEKIRHYLIYNTYVKNWSNFVVENFVNLIMKTIVNETDIVKKMRNIRDEFSKEIMDMTFEQEKEYVKNQLAELKSKRHGKRLAV